MDAPLPARSSDMSELISDERRQHNCDHDDLQLRRRADER